MNIDIGVFARNESAKIASFINNLSKQSIFKNHDHNVRVIILANGCSDATEEIARSEINSLSSINDYNFEIIELKKSGKSRTWNGFVHEYSRSFADILVCMDADIQLVSNDTISLISDKLYYDKFKQVFVSKPVKDIDFYKLNVGPTGRLIAAGGGQLNDFRTSIAGSLYAIRSDAARKIRMPIGIPGEDGFLRAMVLTDLLTNPECIEKIGADERIFHVYESLKDVRGLIRHQTRLVIGGAINSAIFAVMRRDAPDFSNASELLYFASKNEDWLPNLLESELPKLPFGWVPFHFLVKRFSAFGRVSGARNIGMVCLGICFDAVVWVISSARMARGTGPGFW